MAGAALGVGLDVARLGVAQRVLERDVASRRQRHPDPPLRIVRAMLSLRLGPRQQINAAIGELVKPLYHPTPSIFRRPIMRSRSVLLAVALVMAPSAVLAADLVVWWDEGYYAQEDEAVSGDRRRLRAGDRQAGRARPSIPWRSCRTRSRRRSRPASRPTSPSASGFDLLFRNGPSTIGWWISRTPSGTSRTCSIRTQLDRAMLLNARTGQRALYGAADGPHRPTTSTSGRACSSRRVSRSTTSPRSGRRSGRSGATRCSRRCARRLGRDDIWGVGLPMSARRPTPTIQFDQFVAAYEADYVTRDGRARHRRPGDQAAAGQGDRQLYGDLPQGLHPAQFGDLGRWRQQRGVPRPDAW